MAWVHLSCNASALIFTTATGRGVHAAWCEYSITFRRRKGHWKRRSQNHLLKLIIIHSCSAFLKHHLPAFAKANPQIEIRVSPRPNKHPVIKGHYINGREKPICVRNLEPEQILQKTNLLKQASGEKLKNTKKPVSSINESVRGIWSPYHGDLKMV